MVVVEVDEKIGVGEAMADLLVAKVVREGRWVLHAESPKLKLSLS